MDQALPETNEKKCPYEDCGSDRVSTLGGGVHVQSYRPGEQLRTRPSLMNFHCGECDRDFILRVD